MKGMVEMGQTVQLYKWERIGNIEVWASRKGITVLGNFLPFEWNVVSYEPESFELPEGYSYDTEMNSFYDNNDYGVELYCKGEKVFLSNHKSGIKELKKL